jgi:hypothetical protein
VSTLLSFKDYLNNKRIKKIFDLHIQELSCYFVFGVSDSVKEIGSG